MGWYPRLVRRIKYRAFLRGRLSGALAALKLLRPVMSVLPSLHYRSEWVNRRAPPADLGLGCSLLAADAATYGCGDLLPPMPREGMSAAALPSSSTRRHLPTNITDAARANT